MATAQQLQARLDALDELIASGTLSARHGDTAWQGRPLSELLAIRAQLVGQLAAASDSARVRSIRVDTRSGW
jgi:hypothetical protein